MTDQRTRARLASGTAAPKAVMGRLSTGSIVLIESGGILAILGPVVNGVVLIALLPPLVMYLRSRRDRDEVTDAAREALNFQLTAVGVMIALQLVGFVVPNVLVAYDQLATATTVYITVVALVAIVALADLLLSLFAIVRIGSGREFRFPVTFRPVK